MPEMGDLVDKRDIPLDVETFEGVLASLFSCTPVGQQGTLVQWRVSEIGDKLPLGYVTALPFGDMLEVSIYRMEWDVPREPCVDVDNDDTVWESVRQTDWTKMLAETIKSKLAKWGKVPIGEIKGSEQPTPTSGTGDGQGETKPKRPGKDASREDWYRYKCACDMGGVIRFTHAQLAEALSLAEGTARNYYSTWLADAGETDDTMTQTGDTK